MQDLKFKELEELTRKTLKAHYFYEFMDSETENLSINTNDRLTNREELLSEFKKIATYRSEINTDVKDFEYVEFKWTVSDEIKKQITEEKEKYPMANVSKLKAEILTAIIANAKEEISDTPLLKLIDTDCFDNLSKLDKICYIEHYTKNESFSDETLLKAQLLSLIEDPYDFNRLEREIKSGERARFNHFNIFVDPNSQFELLASHNELYKSLTDDMQDHFVEMYFLQSAMHESVHNRLSKLYLWSYKKPDISTLGFHIANREEFASLLADNDIKRHDYFYHHKGFAYSLFQWLEEKEGKPSNMDINEKLYVLNNLIYNGVFDSEVQKEKFNDAMGDFYLKTSKILDNNLLNEVKNKIRDKINNSFEFREDVFQEKADNDAIRFINDPDFFKDYVSTGLIKSHISAIEKMNDRQILNLANSLQQNPGSEYGKMLSNIVNDKFIAKLENNAEQNWPVLHAKQLQDLIQQQFPEEKNTNEQKRIRPKF